LPVVVVYAFSELCVRTSDLHNAQAKVDFYPSGWMFGIRARGN